MSKRKKAKDAEDKHDRVTENPAAAGFLAGSVIEQTAAHEAAPVAMDRRGLLKRGALIAGAAGLGVPAALGHSQGPQRPPQQQQRKVIRPPGPPAWSLWWLRFKFKKDTRAPVWIVNTPPEACTAACIFTPAQPCTALCQTPGEACTTACHMEVVPPPVDPGGPFSPGDPCNAACVTEGMTNICTPGCVTEGSVGICTPLCID